MYLVPQDVALVILEAEPTPVIWNIVTKRLHLGYNFDTGCY